jgi:hypothetical protein
MVFSPSHPARIDSEDIRFLFDSARQWCGTPADHSLKKRPTGFSNMPLEPIQHEKEDRNR